MLGGPYPRGILEVQGPEGLFKVSQTSGKTTIISYHSAELHDTGSSLGRGERLVVGAWEIGDCTYIGGIGRNALITNNKPKETYLPVRKTTFGRLNSESVFKEGSEYSGGVL